MKYLAVLLAIIGCAEQDKYKEYEKHGIYIDDKSSNITVKDNFISKGLTTTYRGEDHTFTSKKELKDWIELQRKLSNKEKRG